jgi:flagellar basal-body rod protein FlgB
MNHATAAIMMKALDGLEARSVATAENIANAGTPGYRPLRVNFEDALRAAAAEGTDAVRALKIEATPVEPGTTEANLRVDLELATASATALRYDSLVEILNRQSQMESLGTKGSV